MRHEPKTQNQTQTLVRISSFWLQLASFIRPMPRQGSKGSQLNEQPLFKATEIDSTSLERKI